MEKNTYGFEFKLDNPNSMYIDRSDGENTVRLCLPEIIEIQGVKVLYFPRLFDDIQIKDIVIPGIVKDEKILDKNNSKRYEIMPIPVNSNLRKDIKEKLNPDVISFWN